MVESESMFYFREEEVSKTTCEAKCEDMIIYLLELGFDLCIYVLDNVSEDPGYERCHGTC